MPSLLLLKLPTKMLQAAASMMPTLPGQLRNHHLHGQSYLHLAEIRPLVLWHVPVFTEQVNAGHVSSAIHSTTRGLMLRKMPDSGWSVLVCAISLQMSVRRTLHLVLDLHIVCIVSFCESCFDLMPQIVFTSFSCEKSLISNKEHPWDVVGQAAT